MSKHIIRIRELNGSYDISRDKVTKETQKSYICGIRRYSKDGDILEFADEKSADSFYKTNLSLLESIKEDLNYNIEAIETAMIAVVRKEKEKRAKDTNLHLY